MASKHGLGGVGLFFWLRSCGQVQRSGWCFSAFGHVWTHLKLKGETGPQRKSHITVTHSNLMISRSQFWSLPHLPQRRTPAKSQTGHPNSQYEVHITSFSNCNMHQPKSLRNLKRVHSKLTSIKHHQTIFNHHQAGFSQLGPMAELQKKRSPRATSLEVTTANDLGRCFFGNVLCFFV